MKLENKLKNRQMKQQNVAKKQRKEQKKLRKAVKDANIRTPRPLETYRKPPGEALLGLRPFQVRSATFTSHDAPLCVLPEEEEEEEFLDVLPTDMLEDECQDQMSAMARRPSFLTRDLSSW